MDLEKLGAQKKSSKAWIGRGLFLLLLLIVTLYVLIWTGNMRCSSVPFMCNIYWGAQSIVTGRTQPSILVLSDPSENSGLGDAELLIDLLNDRSINNVRAQYANINYLNSDQLNHISLIIVTGAKKISTTNLLTFMTYVNQGGRLIWIGDAGTELTQHDKPFENPTTGITKAWERVTEDEILIRFNAFLGVDYVGNFCDLKDCSSNVSNGKLISDSDHRMTRGLKQNLLVYEDYSIVRQTEPNPTPLKIDFGSSLIDNNSKNHGQIFPAIVTSNSNRVAYYAIPPEYLNKKEGERYQLIIENLVEGMLK
jgi:hypothetical protein